MKRVNLAVVVAAVFLMCCTGDTHAATPTQEWLQKGKTASEKGNWPQAVDYYMKAQKRACLSPQVMYDIAVAHSQAGNELLADVWFRAYLGAAPKAANAEKVRAEITRLEKATETKVTLLFQQAEQLVEQLPIRGGNSPTGEGRREEGFKGIAGCRINVGDFKGADDDVAKSKKVSMQQYWSGEYLEGKWQQKGFAEALAKAGDIEGARAIQKGIEDESFRKGLDMTIMAAEVKDAISSGSNLQVIKHALDSRFDFRGNGIFTLSEPILKFAERGDLVTAEALALTESGDYRWDCTTLAEWLLSKGNISEAVKMARSGGKTPPAMAIRGEIEAVFDAMRSGSVTSTWDPSNVFYALDSIIADSIYMDDMPTARKADQLNDYFVKNGVPSRNADGSPGKIIFHGSTRDREYAGGCTQLGKAYIDIEKGSADDVVKRVDIGSRLVNSYSNFKGQDVDGNETQLEGIRLNWLRSLCSFAISRGKLDIAERLVDMIQDGRTELEFTSRILDAYKSKNDMSNTKRMEQKVSGLMTELRLGWDDQNMGNETVASAWINAAQQLSSDIAIQNLKEYISGLKDTPEKAPAATAAAASSLGLGLIKIRALEKIYQ
jgi:hypothetical protein